MEQTNLSTVIARYFCTNIVSSFQNQKSITRENAPYIQL